MVNAEEKRVGKELWETSAPPEQAVVGVGEMGVETRGPRYWNYPLCMMLPVRDRLSLKTKFTGNFVLREERGGKKTRE